MPQRPGAPMFQAAIRLQTPLLAEVARQQWFPARKARLHQRLVLPSGLA